VSKNPLADAVSTSVSQKDTWTEMPTVIRPPFLAVPERSGARSHAADAALGLDAGIHAPHATAASTV